MMATKQMIRGDEIITSEQSFLNSCVLNSTQSATYVKKLTAVAISHILYLRNVFPEDTYSYRKLDDIKLRIISEKTKSPAASLLVKWIKGCFDAIEKKYLKYLMVGIIMDETKPDEIIEGYTFRFSYNESGVDIQLNAGIDGGESEPDDEGDCQCNQNVRDDSTSDDDGYEHDNHDGQGDVTKSHSCHLKNKRRLERENTNREPESTPLYLATKSLLKHVITVTSALDALPPNAYLTLKLLYYEDVTPDDYEPPNFQKASSHKFNFKGDPISIIAGEVDAKFHQMSLKIKTDRSQFPDWKPDESKEEKMERKRGGDEDNIWESDNEGHEQEQIDVEDNYESQNDVRQHMKDLAIGRSNKKKKMSQRRHRRSLSEEIFAGSDNDMAEDDDEDEDSDIDEYVKMTQSISKKKKVKVSPVKNKQASQAHAHSRASPKVLSQVRTTNKSLKLTPKKNTITPKKLFPTTLTSPVVTPSKSMHATLMQTAVTSTSKSKATKRKPFDMRVEQTQASPVSHAMPSGRKRVKASVVPKAILIQSRCV